MRWWEEKQHILAREKVRLDQEWHSNSFEFFVRKDLLWLSGTLFLPSRSGGIIDFNFELKYPDNYPFSTPYIYPKGREKNWVGNHQFISSAFCLDVRDKSWNSSLSAVDIIKSLEKLLLAALEMRENNTGKLEVYEEVEPTKLEITTRTIQCVVPYPFAKSKNERFGTFYYYSPINDSRIIVIPILPEKDDNAEYIKKIIENAYFNVWRLNLFAKSKGLWVQSELQQLESIVFKNDLKSFKQSIIDQKVLSTEEAEKYLGAEKFERIVFLCDEKALLHSKINYKDEKIEFSGCYNQDLSKLNSRMPDTHVVSNYIKKKITIIGCGSAGSVIAEEFVKSGISELILIDNEYLTVENVIRHTCNLTDIGLKKNLALKNRLLQINPFINIDCIDAKISTIPSHVSEKIKHSNLIINATADIEEVINEFCWQHNIPSLHSKVYPKGYGGEIIRVVPLITPCFECMHYMLSNILETQDGFNDVPSGEYIDYNETAEGEILPTPALSIDAKFISLFTAKMALELMTSDSLEEFKSEANIILWGNDKKWVFKERFQCIKVNTSEFESYTNCFVCYGNKQIESELGLAEEEVYKIASEIRLKNVED